MTTLVLKQSGYNVKQENAAYNIYSYNTTAIKALNTQSIFGNNYAQYNGPVAKADANVKNAEASDIRAGTFIKTAESGIGLVGGLLALVSTVASLFGFKGGDKTNNSNGNGNDNSSKGLSDGSISQITSAMKSAKKSGDWSAVRAQVSAKMAEYNTNLDTIKNIDVTDKPVTDANKDYETAQGTTKSAKESEKTAEGDWKNAQKAHDSATKLDTETESTFKTRKEGLQKKADKLQQAYNTAVETTKGKEKDEDVAKTKLADAKVALNERIHQKGQLEAANAKLKATIDDANEKLSERGAEVEGSDDKKDDTADTTKTTPAAQSTTTSTTPEVPTETKSSGLLGNYDNVDLSHSGNKFASNPVSAAKAFGEVNTTTIENTSKLLKDEEPKTGKTFDTNSVNDTMSLKISQPTLDPTKHKHSVSIFGK